MPLALKLEGIRWKKAIHLPHTVSAASLLQVNACGELFLRDYTMG